MSRRAERILDLRHEQLLDSMDALAHAIADGFATVVVKLNADPKVAAYLDAVSQAQADEETPGLRAKLDAEMMLTAQLDEANWRLERKVRLRSAGLRRVLRFAGARRADAHESNEWLQNALDELTEAKAHARECRAQIDRLQASLDAERATVAKLQAQLRTALAAVEAHPDEERITNRHQVLKGAIERQAEEKTKDQVRQYGAHVRALHERSILPAEIARRVNTDLGLSKSALSLYDVKRMLDHMGLGPR